MFFWLGPSPCLFSLLRFPARLRHVLSTLGIAVSIGSYLESSVAYSPLMTFPVGGVGSELVCALQVMGRSLGLLFSSRQDLNRVSSFVLLTVGRLGTPAVVAFWVMEHLAFWKSFGRHRPREFGGSGRMRTAGWPLQRNASQFLRTQVSATTLLRPTCTTIILVSLFITFLVAFFASLDGVMKENLAAQFAIRCSPLRLVRFFAF